MRCALITGVTGQDGRYLAEFLLGHAIPYHVVGLARYCSESKHSRIDHLKANPNFRIVQGDLTDTSRLTAVVNELELNYELIEVYNLAAQSHVQVSFEQPEYTANVDALGTLRLLEAIRTSPCAKKFRFYQAGTSEMFGKVRETPQTELTPFHPRSPYGVAKVYAYWITRNYREAHGMFAVTGILFNHESEWRGEEFVTRKITKGLANFLKTGEGFELGNLDARRDWGHAQDYVEAMWRMLQQNEPEDFVVATGEMHSIREFVREACDAIGLVLEWRGDGAAFLAGTDQVVLRVDPKLYRPAEVDLLVGDASKARDKLNWVPRIRFKELVQRMITNDVELAFHRPAPAVGHRPSDEAVHDPVA
jgi:GDPmannose 4,6-dehydratase